MTVEELNIIISAQTQEFRSAINGVTDRLDELDDRTKKYGENASGVFSKLAKGAAALGIGKIISDSINSGGELEQQLGGVEVVFGSYADSMKNKAKTAFEDMGLSQSEYLAKANKMGALLKGSGFGLEYASATSQAVMQRASDVASIMGVDVKDAMEAVAGAAKGNFTMMDNLGVAMNDTTLQAYAQEKGLGKLETTQQKVSAAMQMFLDKTEYAAGNYSRENDTFSGSLTTLKAQLSDLTAELGSALLPTATTLVTTARSGLEAVTPLIITVGEAVNSVAQYLLGLPPSAQAVLVAAVTAAVVIPKVTKVVDLLNTKIKTSTAWLVILTSVLAAIASVGAERRKLDEGAGAELEQTSDGADKAATSVDGLADSYDGLSESSDAAKKSLADIDTLNIFKSSTASTGGIDFAAIATGAESAAEAVSGAKGEIAALSDEMNVLDLSGLQDTFSGTFSDIGTGISTMWNAFFGSGDEQYDSLKAWTNQIRGLFGDDWTDFFENVGKNLYKIFNGNEYEKDEALREVQNWLQGVMDGAENLVSGWDLAATFVKWWNDTFMKFGAYLEQAQQRGMKFLIDNNVTSIGDYMQKVFTGEFSLNEILKASLIDGYGSGGSGTHISSSGAVHGGGGGSFGNDGGGDRYRYQTYDTPTASTYSSGGLLKSGYGLEDTQKSDQKLSLTITNTLDGVAVGEYSAEYSMRELARSNGY